MNQAANPSPHKLDVNDIDNVHVAFCDSAAGLRALNDRGLGPNAKIRTSAPYLLTNHPDRTEHLEAALTAETSARFKASIRPFVERIYDICIQRESARDYARTLARATAFFHRTIYKALCLREADFVEPRIAVIVQTGDADADRVLNPPWDILLAENPNLQIMAVPVELRRGGASKDVGRLRSWLFRGPAYLGFRLGQALSRRSPYLFQRNRVAYLLKENELVHETAFHLALRSIPIERLPRYRFTEPEHQEAAVIEDDVWTAIAEAYRDHLDGFLCASARDRCTVLALDDLRQHVARQEEATQFYASKLATETRHAVILTNYPGSPEEYGLFAAGDRLGIPTIAFQHGISRELNGVHGDLGVENSAAHLTALYNEAGKRKTDATQFYHGASIAVGFPDKGRRLERLPAWCFKKTEPILYVSSNMYRGTVNTISGSYSDLDSCREETKLIESVFARLPHRVSYKAYPESLRYADPDPALECARRCGNLTMIDGSVDARYFLRSASVIVSARATSTTGWCILSGVPFCFIDVPQQMPLASEIKDAFKAAFFYFSMDEPDLHARLREFLSQPVESIRAQWRQKETARQQFKNAFIDKPTPSAGALLAEYLAEHAFDPAFCADNAMAPPIRYEQEPAAEERPEKHLTPLLDRT